VRHASWGLEQGDLLAPGRQVVRALGGGSAYEAFLVWDEGYHALSGRRPFPRPEVARESEDARVRFPQLHREPEPLPEHLPYEVSALVADMLDPEPEHRPQATDVVARLEPIVAGLG